MIIKPKRHHFTNEPYLENTQTGGKYRRVVGGIGWPSSNHPGFAVIAAEELYADGKYKVRIIRLIEEVETDIAQELVKQLGVIQSVLTKVKWHGDTENPGMAYLLKENKALYLRREPNIQIVKPPKFGVDGKFALYAQLVKKRIGQEKTLYFDGCNKIKGHIMGVEDIGKFKEIDSPAFAALMYAVSAIDLKDINPYVETQTKRVADRTGGY